MSVIWTVISFNWSLGNTRAHILTGPWDANEAKKEFEMQYPGEIAIALIRGNHKEAVTYPLSYPAPSN